MSKWPSVDTLLLKYLFLLEQVALVFFISGTEDSGLLKLQLTQFLQVQTTVCKRESQQVKDK